MKTDEAEAAETKPREISVGNILRWNDDVHCLFPHMRLVGLFIACVGSLTVIISHSKRLHQAADELLLRYVTQTANTQSSSAKGYSWQATQG